MSISEDNTTLNFVLSKNVKHKLQVLADADDKKIGAFVSRKLQDVVEEFEDMILEAYGEDEFLDRYHEIFGEKYPPLIMYKPVTVTVSPEQVKQAIRTILNGQQRLSLVAEDSPRYRSRPDFTTSDGHIIEAKSNREPSE